MSQTIDRSAHLNSGLDYVRLREQGIRMVQQMSGEIWTDYNESDPGVTTLEQICYALTELSYRAEFPVQDLLVDKPHGKIDAHRQALFIPKEIFPCNPLTINDYRKLLVDRVPGVYNAWLNCVPQKESPTNPYAVNGLYDIYVYVPQHRQFLDQDKVLHEDVKKQVGEVFSAHRNLCEDKHHIVILDPIRTLLAAKIEIDDHPSPERILAEILFSTGNFLAPQLQRQPLGEAVATDQPPSKTFNGPFLEHGCIPDHQLQPKMRTVSAQEIASVVSCVPGVVNASDVLLYEYQNEKPTIQTQILIPDSMILELDSTVIEMISMSRNGVRCQPNPVLVQRELKNLWSEYRRTYDVDREYREFFAFPKGEFRDVKRYYSVQNQFPDVYGISDFGLPEGTTKTRRGQAKQFKGYLLVFDQLMADFCMQLASVHQLFSLEPTQQTYFSQSLANIVPNVAPLLKQSYEQGLQAIVANQDPQIQRRNQFLSFLLSLYSEHLDTSSVNTISSGKQTGSSQTTLIRAKELLLNHLVDSTKNRGRGFDYLVADDSTLRQRRNIAGMLIKCRIQLGMPVFGDSLGDLLRESQLNVSPEKPDGAVSNTEQIKAIEKNSQIIDLSTNDSKSYTSDSTQLVNKIHFPKDQRLADAWILDTENPGVYRVQKSGKRSMTVWWQQLESGQLFRVSQLSGKQATIDNATQSAKALAEFRKRVLRRFCDQLYIVEHSLLRPRRLSKRYADEFEYSFTITAVLGRVCLRPIPTFARYQIATLASRYYEKGSRHHDKNWRNAKRDLIHSASPELDADMVLKRAWLLRDEYIAGKTLTLREYDLMVRGLALEELAEATQLRQDVDNTDLEFAYQQRVMDVLRANTPAHIVVEPCYLLPSQMCQFEYLYENWRVALAAQDYRNIDRRSRELEDFLKHHNTRPVSTADIPEDSF